MSSDISYSKIIKSKKYDTVIQSYLVYMCNEVEKRFYQKYNDKKLLERCYKEIDILNEKNQLFLFSKLYDYRNKYGYYYSFRGNTNNLFVLYVLGITSVNPLERHYYCKKCKKIYYKEKVCPKCDSKLKEDGFNLPYEMYDDNIVSVDLYEFNPLIVNFEQDTYKNGYYFIKGKNDIDDDQFDYYKNIYLFLPLFKDFSDIPLCISNGVLQTKNTPTEYIKRFTTIRINYKERASLEDKNYKNYLTNYIESNIEKTLKPKTIDDYIKLVCLSHSTNAWHDNQDELFKKGKITIEEIISSREDVFEYLLEHDISRNIALAIANIVKCRKQKDSDEWNYYVNIMKEKNCSEQFIDILSKILYLYSRGKAIDEIMWYKNTKKNNK